MSNNKQSSVEWLMDKLFDSSYMQKEQLEWFEHAKEIHRTEIIESYASGSNDRLKNTINTNYYNETFNK